jgi:hypothetical protein
LPSFPAVTIGARKELLCRENRARYIQEIYRRESERYRESHLSINAETPEREREREREGRKEVHFIDKRKQINAGETPSRFRPSARPLSSATERPE